MKKTILLVVMLTLVAFVSGAIAQQKPAPAAPASTAPAKVKLEKFMGEIKSNGQECCCHDPNVRSEGSPKRKVIQEATEKLLSKRHT